MYVYDVSYIAYLLVVCADLGANWRWFAGVCSIPVLASFLISLIYIPESPRYLLTNAKYDNNIHCTIFLVELFALEPSHLCVHRYEQAAQVLSQISGVDISVKELLTRPQSATYTMHADMASSSIAGDNGHVHLQSQQQTDESHGVATTLSQSLRILSGQRLRYITLTLMCIWFTLSFGSYGLSTWISTLFQDIGGLSAWYLGVGVCSYVFIRCLHCHVFFSLSPFMGLNANRNK